VSVSLKKIDGVESVKVSLNEGLARIVLKPKNTIRLEQLREVVEKNGFTPKEARVAVRGEIVSVDGHLYLKVMGLNQRYTLSAGPKAEKTEDELKKMVGKTLLVEGMIAPPGKKDEEKKDKKTPEGLQVVNVRELQEETQQP
jgi:copper chaperone CopZ